MAGVVVTSNARIGDHVCILPNTVMHHDVTIGDRCLIGSNVTIAGGVALGENCYIGSGSSIMNGITRRRRRTDRPRQQRHPGRRAGGARRRQSRQDAAIATQRYEPNGSPMDINGANILVTGGCGLIGSTTIDLLLRDHAPGAHRHPRQSESRHARQRRATRSRTGVSRSCAATSATSTRCTASREGMDAVIHMATLRITACAAEPREALGVMCDGSFNVIEAAHDAGVKKVVTASSALRSTASPTRSRRARTITPTTTAPGTAPARSCSRGCCAPSTTCTGLPYVALRYFNVYGPRMDIHGKYTEVLIRWMERIAAGQPPLILGDGKTTMDFVYIDDVARSNILALRSDVIRRGVQRRERRRDQPQRARRRAAPRDGLAISRPEYGPERKVNPVSRRLADTSQGASACWDFAHEVVLDEGLRAPGRLVARTTRRSQPDDPDPDHQAGDGRARGGGRAPRHSVRAGSRRGPRSPRSRRSSRPTSARRTPCAVSNCTTALHLALLAAGVGPGDEVITVSHSYIATANAVRYCGATPVFVDIDPDTFNIDPRLIEAAITPRTRAILCVHQMGMPCDLAVDPGARRGVARSRSSRMPPALSAARSSGTASGRRSAEPHGDIACFSFHPRKVMSTGDGGMLTTANPDWDAKFRLLRQHGDERAGHRAPRLRTGDLRVLPDDRLQLPHDRHPGRGRTRAAEAAAGDRLQDGGRSPIAIERCCAAFPASSCRTSRSTHAPTGRASACACLRAPTSGPSCSMRSTEGSPRAAASCAAIANPLTRRRSRAVRYLIPRKRKTDA